MTDILREAMNRAQESLPHPAAVPEPTLTVDATLLEEIEKELKVYDGIIENADAQIAELTATRDASQRCRAALNAAREHLLPPPPATQAAG